MEKRTGNEIMTIREFAKQTGLSESAVRKLVNEEKVCYMKIGNRYYIHYSKTMDFLLHDPVGTVFFNEPVIA